jgi:PAS domain S-box-containing protein
VSILHPTVTRAGFILVVTFFISLALLVLEELVGGAFNANYVPDMSTSAGARWVGLRLLLVVAAALLAYLYVLARRLRESQAVLTEALRKNELILQYAGEGIYGLDRQGRMTFVNAAAERMLGYTRDDLGKDILHNITPRKCGAGCANPSGECSILATCQDGVPHHCDDTVFQRKDGRPLDVQYISAPIWESGQVTGAVVMFSDKTVRKQSEAVLARWQNVFTHTGWGIVVCNVGTEQLELVNPAFARMHGYSVEEVINLPIEEFFAEECRAELDDHVRLIHEQGHHVWESWHMRKDGSRFPAQIDATAVKDDAGEVIYRVVNVQDITARRQAENVLRESEALLACAQAQGKLGSWQMDVANNRLEWSAECYRIFGLPHGSNLDYQTFLDCIHPDDRVYVDRAWRAAMVGNPYDIQHRIIAEGEVRWVRERAELEFTPDWKPVRGIGTVQDITELKRHEDELLRSRQSLRDLAAHHEKLREEERAHLAREIHDEFGQYLTALRMDTAILKLRFSTAGPELEQHANNMLQTIDKTIGVVRYLASALRPAALDMGLVSAAEWLLSEFETRAGVHCRLHAPSEQLDLDEERCMAAFRILQESLTNIARYARATEVDVRIELVDDSLEMEIRDNGVGFDRAAVQSRKTFGLMGMRERVLRFGGESRIETQLGAGTTVRIRIPYAEGVVQ